MSWFSTRRADSTDGCLGRFSEFLQGAVFGQVQVALGVLSDEEIVDAAHLRLRFPSYLPLALPGLEPSNTTSYPAYPAELSPLRLVYRGSLGEHGLSALGKGSLLTKSADWHPPAPADSESHCSMGKRSCSASSEKEIT